MSFAHGIVLFLAAIVAAGLNSVAGGGSFISFPALLFTGVAPISANGTNTVSLWPGTLASVGAYRKELEAERSKLIPLASTSILGGILGALLLLNTPEQTFVALIPWLMLVATALFTFGRAAVRWIKARIPAEDSQMPTSFYGVLLLQFLIATYGGYFGGGIGILMLASLTLMGMEHIHRMNALKTLLGTAINATAALLFILSGVVSWRQAIVMSIGAIVGGYGGAYVAQKLNPELVRGFVIVVGFGMTAYFFARGT